jgi:hypothetical protein
VLRIPPKLHLHNAGTRHKRKKPCVKPPLHLGVVAARMGDRSEALRISRLKAVATHPSGPAYIAAELGERERAVDLLRDAFSKGVSGLSLNLHRDDYYRRLWDYPPFQELIRPKG